MTFREFFARKREKLESESGWPLTPEEYSDLLKTAEIEWRQIEKEQRERRLAEMEQLSERVLEFASDMEECVNTDDLDGCHEALKQIGFAVVEQLNAQERQEIMEYFNVARSRSSNSSGPGYKTEERKREEDPSVMQGSSGVYGVIKRKRNSSADPGSYAGKVCLMTRHGWRPIVVPGGVESLLRKIGILDKYRDEFPLSTKRVSFQVEDRDRFVGEWVRLEDGTRFLIRVLDTKTGKVVWSKES